MLGRGLRVTTENPCHTQRLIRRLRMLAARNYAVCKEYLLLQLFYQRIRLLELGLAGGRFAMLRPARGLEQDGMC